MAKQQPTGIPIHVLEIPTTSVQLLVPSASVAEVVNVRDFTRVPQMPKWCLGVIAWRSRAVPVISFETLLGDAEPWIGPKSKVLIFFPIPGRQAFEFFGVLSTSEPQPHNIAMTSEMAAKSPRDSQYIASGLNIRGRVVGIPNMEALKQAFYPTA
ncbi:MAG: chemotaxis protein CheW [Gammaproteobacteria bacterium]|nr:chemotaxis protein CheW [Gammaproteobacteria bacterium]